MSARPEPAPGWPPPHAAAATDLQLLPMTPAWLPRVCAVEQAAYSHPWSQLNFADSLAAGYHARLLVGGGGGGSGAAELLGYFIAMHALDDVHLLNLTVAPPQQQRGHARLLLDALAIWSRAQGARSLWLEVRVSNARAQHVYAMRGFQRVGRRKGYYPAPGGLREDAIVMSLAL